jgi:hypothetical protein
VGWQEDLAKIGCRADRKIIEIINIKRKKKGFCNPNPNISKF